MKPLPNRLRDMADKYGYEMHDLLLAAADRIDSLEARLEKAINKPPKG